MKDAVNQLTISIQDISDKLLRCLEAQLCGIDFKYSIVDSGTGRELQNQPIHNIAGLGRADGDRPFRPFAKPMVFSAPLHHPYYRRRGLGRGISTRAPNFTLSYKVTKCWATGQVSHEYRQFLRTSLRDPGTLMSVRSAAFPWMPITSMWPTSKRHRNNQETRWNWQNLPSTTNIAGFCFISRNTL